MSFEGKVIRIACNQSAPATAVDVLTGQNVLLWRGAQAKIQCALFIDTPSVDSFIGDLSNVVSVELIVRKHNSRGTVLVDKVVTTVVNSTFAAWLDLSGHQFEFLLTQDDTSQAVLASGVLPIFYVIKVVLASTTYIAISGYGTVVDVGIVDLGTPPPPPFGTPVVLCTLTRFIGGTPTDLDYIPTVNILVNNVPYFLRINGQTIPMYLDSGPADVTDPGQIAPLDYNVDTNNKHWTRGA